MKMPGDELDRGGQADADAEEPAAPGQRARRGRTRSAPRAAKLIWPKSNVEPDRLQPGGQDHDASPRRTRPASRAAAPPAGPATRSRPRGTTTATHAEHHDRRRRAQPGQRPEQERGERRIGEAEVALGLVGLGEVVERVAVVPPQHRVAVDPQVEEVVAEPVPALRDGRRRRRAPTRMATWPPARGPLATARSQAHARLFPDRHSRPSDDPHHPGRGPPVPDRQALGSVTPYSGLGCDA